ncbi:MAG: ATP-binding protein [Oligoflexia bacterium]|nr:ATP-binding protein [Oligoflexia bacterium]
MKNPSSTSRELVDIRRALDQSAIVAITDNAGVIIHVNDRFCEISKFSREELIGKTHQVINSGTHPKEFFVNLWKTISSGQTWVGEIRNKAKGGSYYWVYTTIVPFLDDAGKPYQYVSIRFEITQKKQAEESLALYAKRLEVSNRELQDFASVAAHDLQEPLRKIIAFSERLKTKFRDSLPAEAIDYFDRMMSSVSRMQVLIDDLLTFSRVTSQAQPFIKTDLDKIIREVISDLEIRIEQTNAKISVDSLPQMNADPSQMRQLFQNLISNAIKFQKQGVPPEILIKSKIENSNCIISVSDNGIGFDEKYLDRIFTIFQRLHGRGEYEGTGIGLAVCRRIVERHNGHITAESNPGTGSKFIVNLPLKQKTGEPGELIDE